MNNINTELQPALFSQNEQGSVDVLGIDSVSETVQEINNGLLHDVKLVSERKINMIPGESPMFNNLQENAVKGIHDQTEVSDIYFSNQNINLLQATIRYEVNKKTDKIIDKQSPEELSIVMRSIYLQHGNPVVPSNDIINEVNKMNELVVDYCVDQITTQVIQYQGYIEKLTTLPTPIDRPEYLNKENYTYDMSNLL
tara:strand:- start:1061 stop:1651 length:591 start_codon:yes stop_codon:yes gene_type:complete